jgi:uncharacterized protein
MTRRVAKVLILIVAMSTAGFAEAEKAAAVRKRAEAGEAEAQFMLGQYFLAGEAGVPKDLVEALKWYRKSAEQGNAGAQSILGVAYARGEGVPKDSAEAVTWYRRAAAQDHAGAQYNLGHLYYSGEGVPRDLATALRYWHQAAEGGLVQAQCDLGKIYTNGYDAAGVRKDYVQAYVWWSLAAAQGNEMAAKYQALLERSMTADQQAEAVKQAKVIGKKRAVQKH